MKAIYFIVGINSEIITDFYYPVMELMSNFWQSEYAHNIRVYVNESPCKMIVDPIYDKAFENMPDGQKVHIFMVRGKDAVKEAFQKYVDEYGWERWKVTPYLQFERSENGEMVPIKWYSQEFKDFLYLK